MLKTLRVSKWADQIATAKEVEAFVAEAKAIIEKHGWEDKKVYPWGRAMNIMDALDYVKDFDHCTFSSKIYDIELLNGLIPLIEKWEYVEEHGVPVRFINTGKVKKLLKEEAKAYEGLGVVEIL